MAEAGASWAFVERNFTLVRRYIGWEAVFVTYSIVNSLTIAFIGVTQGKEKVMYLVVGAMIWGFLSLLFHEISESIAWERWEGTIEYTFMAPIHRFTHLGGNCVFAIIYGTLRSFLLLFCVAIFFRLSLQGANLVTALIILMVSGLSFVGLGLVAAVLPLLSTEKGAQATHIFEAVLLLISGVYYEVDVLPAWIRPLSAVSPATYTLRAIRRALLEGASITELWPTVALILGLGIVLIPGGLVIFRAAEGHAKRTGKLKRSG
ncbi:ABC transporter [candidate division TA06 bacterium DG_24]|uniref:Transport permease protein n=3 Tax=Bacteria division TA06 TaxID=1156500 RepID=A0A0S8JNT3_UNCT6|nr:MAG: ABC transporter [candidate division TA06 bacterium DG_24]KPK69433.1 MAG: ABC transporter [candidate division TA06 bacterium SM23_40]KPL11399.1 MAG: ABC transporter [candidate division TA06 bacterium SM1_40]